MNLMAQVRKELSSLRGASSDRTCVVRQLLQQDDVRKKGFGDTRRV